MKRFAVLAAFLAALLPAAACAQQLRGPGALQALAAPVAGYPDNVIVDIAAAAADPRLLGVLPAPIGAFVLEHPDWARDFAYAYALQPTELWQQIDALRQAQGGFAPVAGLPAALPRYVVAAPYLAAAVPPPAAVVRVPRVVVVRPAVVRVSAVHPAAHRRIAAPNGPPSRAAQLQNAQSAAFVERARHAGRPSPAARLQQRRR